MSKGPHNQRHAGLALAIAIGIAFLLFCSLRVIGDSESTLSSQRALRTVLDEPIWHTQLARNIALFAAAHLLLASALGVACWLFARMSEIAWPGAKLSRTKWVLVWFVVATAWILIANAALYPWSLLGEPYAQVVKANTGGVDILLIATILALTIATSAILRAAWVWRVHTRPERLLPQRRSAIIVGTLVVVLGISGLLATKHAATTAYEDRPNVVIIGIDSLRWDVPFGGMGEVLTPNIDRFLAESVNFTDAVTPLARTFPSWVATLTGRYPHTTGAIVNLLPRDLIRTGETLPETLRRSGYETLYAIDEVRFSNLDSTYGFDRMVTPPIGASDFLLGALNDTPLSNLIVNTRLGKWLFPYSYGNRAAPVTYEPNTFAQWFERELPHDKPIFVAAHLTLAHWPYYWATAPERELNSADSLQQLYSTAVKRADKQFAAIIEALERQGILDNAIVVVMSDHGEAIGKEHDNPYQNSGSLLRGLAPAGHGTSVLSPQQYRVVLGLRSFGNTLVDPQPMRRIESPVSLIDLTPTVLDLLRIQTTDSFDGRSLMSLINGESAAKGEFSDRIRFTETEFNPRGFQPGKVLTQSTLDEIASFYRLDPDTDRILIKPDRRDELLQQRQYAAIQHKQLVAAVPAADNSSFRFLLAERGGGSPIDLASAGKDQLGNASALKSALIQQFKDPLERNAR